MHEETTSSHIHEGTPTIGCRLSCKSFTSAERLAYALIKQSALTHRKHDSTNFSGNAHCGSCSCRSLPRKLWRRRFITFPLVLRSSANACARSHPCLI